MTPLLGSPFVGLDSVITDRSIKTSISVTGSCGSVWDWSCESTFILPSDLMVDILPTLELKGEAIGSCTTTDVLFASASTETIKSSRRFELSGGGYAPRG